ncbi:MAG: hypothetical protein AAF969_05460 [Bacteroidota bacterium]
MRTLLLSFLLLSSYLGFTQEKPSFESRSGKDSLSGRHFGDYVRPKDGIVLPEELTENYSLPTFKKCSKTVGREAQRKCFGDIFYANIRKKLLLPMDGVPGTEVALEVKMVFQKNGEVGQIEFLYSNDPTGSLEKAVMKMLRKLPKFAPGTKDGTPVDYPFSFPLKITY